jgi:thiol-disulfide isomerase/thioredoxin
MTLAAVPALADKVGDPAAPLTISSWVKGAPVDVKDGKSIYVVEFWATWCPPCRVSIPHLTEMQAKFKGKVVFVGISDEDADTVKPFVEKMADKMAYTVAIDSARKSSEGYMTAYGQGGIPHAFIVGKDGKVWWQGHPMDGLDKALDQITSDKYDLAAAIKADEARALKDDYQKAASTGDPKAKQMGEKLLAAAGTDLEALTELAFSIAVNARAGDKRDFALAEKALDAAEKTLGGKKDARILGTRGIVRFESGKEEEGLALAKEAVSVNTDENEKPKYERFVQVMEARLKKKEQK